METRFYHLQRSTLEVALRMILERAYARGDRILVLAGSDERCEALSSWLWTERPESFLPHGTSRDGHDSLQPIYLTHQISNPNAAAILVQCDGAAWPVDNDFPVICDLFDGNDQEAVASARQRWAEHKKHGRTVIYFQQNAAGKWEEAARA